MRYEIGSIEVCNEANAESGTPLKFDFAAPDEGSPEPMKPVVEQMVLEGENYEVRLDTNRCAVTGYRSKTQDGAFQGNLQFGEPEALVCRLSDRRYFRLQNLERSNPLLSDGDEESQTTTHLIIVKSVV